MSYLAFLLIFIVPPVVVLGASLKGVAGMLPPTRRLYALPLTSLIAFLYTTPWDNYLVYKGVWSYGQDRVVGTAGYVPLEEYAFFLLQPILTGLFLYHLLARWPDNRRPATRTAWLLGGMLYAAVTVIGLVLLASPSEQYVYMGLILSWAGPVLLGMWLYAGEHLWSLRHIMVPGVLVPTFYLWIVDCFAIRNGIWDISDRWSLGVEPLGLPLEEAVFFLVTNLLVFQSVVLFLHGNRIPVPWKTPPIGS